MNLKEKKTQTPAALVVSLFGSLRAVGDVLGLRHTSPRLWLRRGFVPSVHHRKLLLSARERGIALTEHDLIWGRRVD